MVHEQLWSIVLHLKVVRISVMKGKVPRTLFGHGGVAGRDVYVVDQDDEAKTNTDQSQSTMMGSPSFPTLLASAKPISQGAEAASP